MTDLIDLSHVLFSDQMNFVDFVETDDICSQGVGEAYRAAPEFPPHNATLNLLPPTYYSLGNGIADNRRINDTVLKIAADWKGCAFGVAEPKYGDCAREEIHRIASLGAKGVVWSPRAQGVFGNDMHMISLCRLVAELGMVSLIRSAPYSINESLMRIWDLAANCVDAPMVALGALVSWENIQTIQQKPGGPPNLLYDISGISTTRDLESVVAAVGPARVLFGSGGGRFLRSTLELVQSCAFDAGARDVILHGNAASLLKL